MATEGGIKRPRVSATPPPRTLNVQKFAESRALELESLHSIVAGRLNNDFRSQRNKRRRTTGHDNRYSKNRWRKKQKTGFVNKDGASDSGKEQKKVPRRVLRRIGLRSNPATGFCTSGDGTKRLRTHLWHAKRFTMTKRWGFYLPSRLHGRGRGSRALLRWFKRGVLVHDASYISALQLEGPEDSLLSILRMVLVPTPSVQLEELSNSILSGVSYGSAMLHHVGVPSSQLIAPVTYMWRPLIRKDIEFESKKVLTCAHNSTTNSIACSSPFRQLWLWIHAAAFSEGCEALRCANKEQMAVTGICVSCIPLDGKLAKLEVIGSKAIQILQKILHPVSESLEASVQLKKFSAVGDCTETQLQKSYILKHAQHLPFGAILSLMVEDPRNLPEMESGGVSSVPSTDRVDNVPQNKAAGASTLTACSYKEKEIISSLWSEPEVNSVLLSGNKDLWDIQNVLNTPVEENLLCMKKHHKRMTNFCLDNTNFGLSTSKNAEDSSNSCPILLLKDNCRSGSSLRWSVILPLSWVKAFWIPLVSHGAHAIGFREKQQIACNVGLPSFPFDFPDCMSYSISMSEEAAVSDKKAELRPPSMRPLRVPIPPPWSSVRSFVELPEVRDNQSKIGSEEVGPATSLEDSVEQDSSCLGGFVVRTSVVLRNFLSEVPHNHLLLFLNATEREKGFSDFSKDVSNPSRVPLGANQTDDRKLCFLRIHLHAHKEGVFEEGAVVCAPRLSEISLWISRSDEQEGGLLIPQSSIGSYFVQLPSGQWELQKPKDSVARESYRLPIGFVTTGFVLGSTKPVAEAFCEATQLSRLRGEQWEGLERKREQEIFVLVRNLRSAAYRLALATIILEQQQEDIEFM